MAKKSKWIESYVQCHESVLNSVKDLINEQGETTLEVQDVINDALDELKSWYEMREMFS